MRSKPDPERAFMVAALVLAALPLLVVVGLAILGAAAKTGALSFMNPLVSGSASGVFVAAFVVWVLLVVIIVLALVWLIVQRKTHG